MTWNPFKKKEEAQVPVEQAPKKAADPSEKKGRPTPKMKQAQAAGIRPLVPVDRKASAKAAKARLRPILMTVLTCVFGMIPLVIATGVGANGNSTLGSGVVGGMIVGTLALLFLVPSLFIVFQHLQEKVKPIQFTNTPDWMIEAEIEDSKKENEEKK